MSAFERKIVAPLMAWVADTRNGIILWLVLMVVMLAVGMGQALAAEYRTNPKSMGCVSERALDTATRAANQHDMATFNRLLSTGRCAALTAGQPVYIQDLGFASSEVRINGKRWFVHNEVFTVKAARKRERKAGDGAATGGVIIGGLLLVLAWWTIWALRSVRRKNGQRAMRQALDMPQTEVQS